jgi:hypothetical protein
MGERDDFPAPVKKAVALRAGYRCSFEGCGIATVGASEESPVAHANIGVAAHICAAAPGGRRYDLSMTPEERSAIDNAIWLCANHATLIDRDESTYTRESLHTMKAAHERQCVQQLKSARVSVSSTGSDSRADLVAIGHNVIAIGELSAVRGASWTLLITDFVIGGTSDITKLSETFDQVSEGDRFVLLNADGDGRALAAPPAWRRLDGHWEVSLEVASRSGRIRAQDLGADLALEDGDLSRSGWLVSGIARLPQHLEICLGTLYGQEWFDPTVGSRISEYRALYGDTPWFPRLVKLEIVRLASIPQWDKHLRCSYNSLQCVEKVVDVELLPRASEGDRLPVRVTLDVSGIGRWQHDLRVFISEYPPPENPLPSTYFGPPSAKERRR